MKILPVTKVASDYSEEELEQFREEFAPAAQRFRQLERILKVKRFGRSGGQDRLIFGIIIWVGFVIILGLVKISESITRWILPNVAVTIPGWIIPVALLSISFLLLFSAFGILPLYQAQLKCPACHNRLVSRRWENYCPECCSSRIESGNRFRLTRCNSCGKRFGRQYKIRACTHCQYCWMRKVFSVLMGKGYFDCRLTKLF
jgi:hypothetical protein